VEQRSLVAQMLPPGAAQAGAAFAAASQRLRGLGGAALACFAVEYLGLFGGVSTFMRGHACAYILLHFAGAVLTGLFCSQVGPPVPGGAARARCPAGCGRGGAARGAAARRAEEGPA
jgi:hypothetical protein